MKKSYFSCCIISLACIVMLSSCFDDDEEETATETYTVAVRTIVADIQTLQPYIELNGSIEAKNSVKVYPNIAGKIAGTKVNLGSYVRKGDVMLLVDPSTPGFSYALSQVTAPISGSVISIPPQPGVKVVTDVPVITIGDLSKLEIKTYIPEKFFGMLKAGLRAEVSVEAYPGVIFAAAVKSVSPVVDEASRTVETILQFDSKDNRITAGMFSKIKLYLSRYEGVIAIPETAITERNDQKIVFLITEDSTAKSQPVTVGITVDGQAQILEGLSVGQQIITEGVSSVQDGSAVTILSAAQSE